MKSSELIRKFEKAGWVFLRENTHKIYQHPLTKKTVAVPFHGSKEVATGTAKKLLKELSK
jgi:predicted RNA binding protein YcfA (HicA-like mRNA interferase family)